MCAYMCHFIWKDNKIIDKEVSLNLFLIWVYVYVSNRMLNMCCITQLLFISATCVLILKIHAFQYANTQQPFILNFFVLVY